MGTVETTTQEQARILLPYIKQLKTIQKEWMGANMAGFGAINETSSCETELYIVYKDHELVFGGESPHNRHRNSRIPLMVHEKDRWYVWDFVSGNHRMPHTKTIIKYITIHLPNVHMCTGKELTTVAQYGITGIVLGKHEPQEDALRHTDHTLIDLHQDYK